MPINIFQSRCNPIYETMSFGERLALKREKQRVANALIKALARDKKELDKPKVEKEDPIPLAVRNGLAREYICACKKKFYITASFAKCPACGLAKVT